MKGGRKMPGKLTPVAEIRDGRLVMSVELPWSSDIPEHPDVLNMEETAKFLRCSKSTLKTMISDGTVKSFLVRGQRRIRRLDLEEYIRKGISKSPAAKKSRTRVHQ